MTATLVHVGFALVIVVVGIAAFYFGSKIIRQNPTKGRALVDLGATVFASFTLLAVFFGFVSVAHIKDGALVFFYNIFSEPNPPLVIAGPLCLAISFGLSFAKRWADYKSA